MNRPDRWALTRLSTAKRGLRRNPAVRRLAVPAYRLYADARAAPRTDPPILANSMPKSGTHLLTSLLGNLPRSNYSGRHYELDQFELPAAWSQTGNYDWEAAQHWLSLIKPGQYATGHFPAEEPIIEVLESLNFRCLFIIRDPRDVVVSAVHYIVGHPHHPLRNRYVREFSSIDEMILATIDGRAPLERERGWRSIGEELERYGGWLPYELGYVVRFEDLIGEKGGGDRERQREEIAAIAAFVGRPLSGRALDGVMHNVWGHGSATFRKGQAGDWRRYFTEAHREAFKREAGEKLVELGYEDCTDW